MEIGGPERDMVKQELSGDEDRVGLMKVAGGLKGGEKVE